MISIEASTNFESLLPVDGGKDTAAAIPGAELIIIDGMGHDLPHDGTWPQIIKAIVDHTHKVSFEKF